MPRDFSIVRRRPNLVDLATPDQGGAPPIVEYRFAAALNFDAATATLQDVPRTGLKSATVVDNSFTDARYKNKVRFLWNPADYTTEVPGITDISPIFVTMATRELGQAFGTAGAIHMIVAYDPSSDPPIVLNGDAPDGAAFANSLEIQLPRMCDHFVIKNLSANNLHVALTPGGPEYRIDGGATPPELLELVGETTASVLFVRGDGGVATFNAICSMQNSSVR